MRSTERERRLAKQGGAGMVEYALLVALIGILLIAALTGLRMSTGGLFQRGIDAIPSSSGELFEHL